MLLIASEGTVGIANENISQVLVSSDLVTAILAVDAVSQVHFKVTLQQHV